MIRLVDEGELCRGRAEIEDAELMNGNLRIRADVAGGPAAARRLLRRWQRIRRRQIERDAAVRGYLAIGGEAG